MRSSGERETIKIHLFNSIPHSGQAGFLIIKPTLGQQSAQKTFLQRGHCHAGGLNNPPTSFPQTEQKPLTINLPHLPDLFNQGLHIKFFHLINSFVSAIAFYT